MGYLPQFKNDVFVSYRHASDKSSDPWVIGFCDALREHLLEQVGEVKIWRDKPELHGGDNWRASVSDALNNAAIFLAIISRTYFDADECRRELDEFLGQINKEKGEKLRRIVPVLKQPPKDEKELAQELGNIHRHQFFQWDPPGTQNYKELGRNADKDCQNQYNETLARLAQDLTVALEELRGRARKDVLGKVFVATVGPELNVARDSLRADLRQRGFEVVPEHIYLRNSSTFNERLASDLESAKLYIHLVSQNESTDPLAAEHSRVQLEKATEISRRMGKPPPMVWILPAQEIHPSARALIDCIRQELPDKGVEYWEGGMEDFKTQIYDKLPRNLDPVAASPTEVALLVEMNDIAATAQLNLLLSELGIEPHRVKFVSSAPENPGRLAKALARCAQCVIFWGSRSEDWVRDLLDMDLLKHLGRERLCVLTTAPSSDEKTTFTSTRARIVQGVEGSPETGLRAFLNVAGAPR